MYCSGCGQPISPGQQWCSSCGRPIVQASSVTPAAWFYTRVHRHIQSLGILWIVYGVWTLLEWLLAMSVFAGRFAGHFGHWTGMPWADPFGHMQWLVHFITIVLVGRTILSVVTGLALFDRAPWARILAIVAAFLTLLRPITGTLLAIYTLWVLLPGSSAQEYGQMAKS